MQWVELLEAKEEALRFLKRVQAMEDEFKSAHSERAPKASDGEVGSCYSDKKRAAVKRASLDLTYALAAIRRRRQW